MVSINPIVENMSREDVDRYSEKYLLGFTNLSQYGFKIAGLNKVRKRFGLEPLKESMVDEYRHNYIISRFTQDEIYNEIYRYMSTHKVAKERYALNGLELFDCAFRRTYVKQFKALIGVDKFKEISEKLRVDKMMCTQKEQYGGVGLASEQSLEKSQITKYKKVRNELKKYLDTGIASNYLQQCISAYELEVFRDLCSHFGSDDVVSQYGFYPKDDRYPFVCDIYIKSLDLFIELNYYVSHGDHWFDKNSEDDLIQLNSWKKLSKHGSQYHKYIEVWTFRDLLKREYARKNNLNYLVFWQPKDTKRIRSDYKIWKDDYNYDFKEFLKNHPENTY